MTTKQEWAPAGVAPPARALPGGSSGSGGSASDGTGQTSGGGIDRVNAFDGLFLRAEHLTAIEDYAQALAYAVGQAGGPGVVCGLGLRVQGQTLHAADGLAIDAEGRPLRADGEMTLDLSTVELAAGEYAEVWVSADSWPYGQEAVQGVICDDPCSGGGSRQPYRAEGVRLGFTRKLEGGLLGEPSESRRSWLASRLFAQERTAADGWPGRAGDGVLDRWWRPLPTPSALAGTVPVGVLLAGDSGWIVDTWAVRRDRDATPPTAAWQWRLGMRPWSAFVAQVLQFQDQLGDLLGVDAPASRASATENLLGLLGDISRAVMKSNRSETQDRLNVLLDDVRTGGLGQQVAGAGLVALPALGITELPPAGLLPRFGVGTPEAARDAVHEMLGGASDVRVCTGVLGDVGGFIAAAQHRERIPLGLKGRNAVVDVLWVGESTSDWMAFARRDGIDCGTVVTAPEPETEPVLVSVIDEDVDVDLYRTWRAYLRQPDPDKQPDLAKGAVEVQYPVRTWALPATAEYAAVEKQVGTVDVDVREVILVAVVTDDVRRQLGVIRATALGLRSIGTGTERFQTHSVRGRVEAIVVLISDTGR